MSNGKCSTEEDEILEGYDRFLAAQTTDLKMMILGEMVRDNFLGVARKFAEVYHRLPLRPWMIKVGGAIGVGGVAALIWGASAFTIQVKTTKECALEAKLTASEAKNEAQIVRNDLTAQMRPISEGMAVTNAKLDMLMAARGISRPSRRAMNQAREELGLPPDSTNQDSAPSGP